ncbi:hypothetical protein ACP4OV_028101 [Aristida adscensionis]
MNIRDGMRAVDRVPDNPKIVMIMNTQEYCEIPLRGDGAVPPAASVAAALQSNAPSVDENPSQEYTSVPSQTVADQEPNNKCVRGRKRKQNSNIESVASAASPPNKTRSSPIFATRYASEEAHEDRRAKPPRPIRQKQKLASTRGWHKKVEAACASPSMPPVSDDADPLGSNEQAGNSRTKINVRCNPGDVVAVISKMTDEQRQIVSKLGFSDLLGIRLEALECRALLPWLMDRIDPTDMIMRVGPGKELPITPREIGLVLGLPTSGRTIKELPWKEAVECRRLFCEAIGASFTQPMSREYLLERVVTGATDPLTIRSFFMVLFNRLLFPGSSCNISTSDIAKRSLHESFGSINWSLELYNDLKAAVKRWHERKLDQPTQTIFGCAVFVVVSALYTK